MPKMLQRNSFNNLKNKIIIKHQQYAKYHGKHWSYLKDLNKNIFCSSQLGFTNLKSIPLFDNIT